MGQGLRNWTRSTARHTSHSHWPSSSTTKLQVSHEHTREHTVVINQTPGLGMDTLVAQGKPHIRHKVKSAKGLQVHLWLLEQ